MADLRRVCIEGFCSDVPEYTAGDNINISSGRVISADLSNYYNKSQVDELIGDLEGIHFTKVDALPQTGDSNTIYLVPQAGSSPVVYDEYVYLDGSWEKIGNTDIDLSDYYTKDEVDALIQPLTKARILNALGYRETTIRMIDTNNNEVEVTVLVANS